MALLKDLIVTGASRMIGDAYLNTIKSGVWQGSIITETYLPDASTSTLGVVQLNSAVNSDSETEAATPKAVKSAYALANGKWTYNASTIQEVKVNSATAADSAGQVKTIKKEDNASFYMTFVDSNNTTATAENVYTDAGITYNPSTNKLTATLSNSLSFSKDGGQTSTSTYNGSAATTISYDSLMPEAAVTFIKANLYTPAVSNNKPANNNALDLSAGSNQTTFTVTCKDAAGTLMDMTSEYPKYGTTSFTKSSTGTYTYTLTETLANLKTSTTQAKSISIACKYGGVDKTLSSTRYIKKPSYIFYSATASYDATTGKTIVDNLLSSTATTGVTVANTLNNYSITGDRNLTITNEQYCWIAVPVYSDATKLSNVKQLGSPWLENTTGVSIATTSWGTYKLFRSKNTGNGKSQTVTFS